MLYSVFTMFLMDHTEVDNGKANIVDFVLFLFVLSILLRRIVDALIGKVCASLCGLEEASTKRRACFVDCPQSTRWSEKFKLPDLVLVLVWNRDRGAPHNRILFAPRWE